MTTVRISLVFDLELDDDGRDAHGRDALVVATAWLRSVAHAMTDEGFDVTPVRAEADGAVRLAEHERPDWAD